MARSATKDRAPSGTDRKMTPASNLELLSYLSWDLEDSIAALCMVASVAHVQGNYGRRDDAVDLAAELARGLVEDRG
jgi:hypothetical protein